MSNLTTEEQIEKILSISKEVMKLSRNTLVVNLRFLDSAISNLELIVEEKVPDFATDGEHIFFNPIRLLKLYKNEKNEPTRSYLHMIFHCVFQHFFINTLVDQELWDLACDIAVENIVNELNIQSTDVGRVSNQKSEINRLKSEIKILTAEKIYNYYQDNRLSQSKMNELKKAFRADDHAIWYLPPETQGDDENGSGDGDGNGKGDTGTEENGSSTGDNSGDDRVGDNGDYQTQNRLSSQKSISEMKQLQQRWKDISERMQTDIETFSKRYGDMAGGLTQNLQAVNREKYDYTNFLKKFAVMGEAMKVNDDEFDYIFYTYGLSLYENMPLIEPLEYKEVKRIKEFVIAIDTSGSVSGPLVQTFIQKTYNILKQEESFFTKINLHIIQCDTVIQEDAKITNQEEFDNYLKTMTLKGFGGTDFRPVFSYVDEMVKNKEFVNLKGLIYFTDGYGVFPERQPDYHTAFVFVDNEYGNPEVPVWAIKLVLQDNEI